MSKEEEMFARLQDVLLAHDIADENIVQSVWNLGVFREPQEAAPLAKGLQDLGISSEKAVRVAEELVAHELAVHASAPPQRQQQIPSLHVDPAVESSSFSTLLSTPQRVLRIVEEVRREASELAGKHIVGFLGCTGSGKTTEMHFLMGRSLRLTRYQGEKSQTSKDVIELVNVGIYREHSIGHKLVSETQRPFVERAPAEMGDLFLVDLPGDFDTSHNLEIVLRNALLKPYIVRNAASVRLLFILPIELIRAKKGSGIDEDLSDILKLFPSEDKSFASCMLTLIAPIPKGEALLRLTQESSKSFCNVAERDLCQLLESLARRDSSSRNFLSSLLTQDHKLNTKLCYIANPLGGPEELHKVQRLIADLPAVHHPATKQFRVGLPHKAEDLLMSTCEKLLTAALSGLALAESGAESADDGVTLDSGASSAGSLLALLNVLINELELNIRCFAESRARLRDECDRVWKNAWLSLDNHVSRRSDPSAAVALIQRLRRFFSVSAEQSKIVWPLNFDEHLASSINALEGLVSKFDVRRETTARTVREFVASLKTMEAALSPLQTTGQHLPFSSNLATRLYDHLRSVGKAIKVEGGRPHSIANDIFYLKSFVDCEAWVHDATLQSIHKLVAQSVKSVVDSLKELSQNARVQLQQVLSGSLQESSQSVSALPLLCEMTSSQELAEALDDPNLKNDLYTSVVAVDALITELNFLDSSSMDTLPRQMQLVEMLSRSGDEQLRAQMQQKRESIIREIREKAMSLQNSFIAGLAQQNRLFRESAKKSFTSQAEPSNPFRDTIEGSGFENLRQNLQDVATLTHADDALLVPAGQKALEKMVVALTVTLKETQGNAMSLLGQRTPVNCALSTTLEYWKKLIDVVPTGAEDTTAGQAGLLRLEALRVFSKTVADEMDARVVKFIEESTRPFTTTDGAPSPDWVQAYMQSKVVMKTLELFSSNDTIGKALHTLESNTTNGKKACLDSITTRATNAKSSSDFGALAKIVAEELSPLREDLELKKESTKILRSCERYISSLCEEADGTDPNLDPSRFLELWNKMKELLDVFTDADCEGSVEVYSKISTSLTALREKNRGLLADFNAKVAKPTGTNIFEAVRLLESMNDAQRSSATQLLNVRLRDTLEQACFFLRAPDSTKPQASLENIPGLMLDNAVVWKLLDKTTQKCWEDLKKLLNENLASTKEALQQALASGHPEQVQQRAQQHDLYFRLCPQVSTENTGSVIASHFATIIQQFKEQRSENPIAALRSLAEAYVAAARVGSSGEDKQWTDFAVGVRTCFISTFAALNNKVELHIKNGEFGEAARVPGCAESLLLFVQCNPSLSELLDKDLKSFQEQWSKLAFSNAEDEAIRATTDLEGRLKLLFNASDNGRHKIIADIAAQVKAATSQDMVQMGHPAAVKTMSQVLHIKGVLDDFLKDEQPFDPIIKSKLTLLQQLVSKFHQDNVEFLSLAVAEIVEEIQRRVSAGRICMELVAAFNGARVLPQDSQHHKTVHDEVRKFWLGLQSSLKKNFEHIAKGALDTVSFTYIEDVIYGFRSLRPSPQVLAQHLPQNLATGVRYVNAEKVENDLSEAMRAYYNSDVAKGWEDKGDTDALLKFYDVSTQLKRFGAKILRENAPRQPIGDEQMKGIITKLAGECVERWQSVNNATGAETKTHALKTFQKPMSLLMAIEVKLGQQETAAEVTKLCREELRRAMAGVDRLLERAAASLNGDKPTEIAVQLSTLRESSLHAPCLHGKVELAIASILGRLQARVLRDVGLYLDEKCGGAGKQIIRDNQNRFADASSKEWLKKTIQMPPETCVDSLQCDPKLSTKSVANLKSLLRLHDKLMQAFTKELRIKMMEGGSDKTRDFVRFAVREAASVARNSGGCEGYCTLVARLSQAYGYFSIQATANDGSGAEAGDPVAPHSIQILTIYRLLALETENQDCISRLARLCSNVFVDSGAKERHIPNHLVQILTGEGKSITLALLAATFVSLGLNADVVCYSEYLTARDKEKMLPFFVDVLGFHADQVRYLTFSQLCALRTEGVGPVALQVLTKPDEPITVTRNSISGGARMLLIDEVDVFFSKRFYGATYNAGVTLTGDEEFELVKVVLENVGRPFDVLVSNELQKLKLKYKDAVMHKLLDGIALKFVESSSCFARSGYQVNGKTGEIEYKIGDAYESGVVFPNETSLLYMHLLRKKEVREDVARKFIGLDVHFGHFSYAEIPAQAYYKGILGVTGTLKSTKSSIDGGSMILTQEDRDILKNDYNLDQFTFAPSVFGESLLNNRSGFEYARDTQVLYSDASWTTAIVQAARDAVASGKGACIIFVKNMKQYLPLLAKRGELSTAFILTESTPADQRRGIVSASVAAGAITLATRSFGRGTDFWVPDDTHVTIIQTFYSSTESEHVQIRGRTARMGQHGSYKMILCSKHMEGKFFKDIVLANSTPPPGAPADFDPAQQISDAVAQTLRQAVATSSLAQLLIARRGRKMNEKTADRLQRKSVAKTLDNESWRIVETLLSAKPVATKLGALVQASLKQVMRPLIFTVLIDVSGSMSGAPWAQLMTAFDAFRQEMAKTPSAVQDITVVSVIFFGSEATEYFTGKICQIQPLPPRCPGGGTDYGAGFRKAQEVFARPQFSGFSKKIVFFTDGYPNSNSQHERAVKEIHEQYPTDLTEFFCIYFSSGGEVPVAIQTLHHQFETLKVTSQLLHPKNVNDLKMVMTTAAHSGPMHRH